MSTYTRENTEIAVDIEGVGQQHRAEAGGMIIALERWKRRARHGRDVRRAARRRVPGAALRLRPGRLAPPSATPTARPRRSSAGEAYYLRPGHNVHIDQDAEFVEFTQADQTPGINTLEL